MKNVRTKNIIGSSIVAMGLLLPGCGIFKSVSSENTAFFIAYNSGEIIREAEKVATILSIYDFAVDDVSVTPQNMRSFVQEGEKVWLLMYCRANTPLKLHRP